MLQIYYSCLVISSEVQASSSALSDADTSKNIAPRFSDAAPSLYSPAQLTNQQQRHQLETIPIQPREPGSVYQSSTGNSYQRMNDTQRRVAEKTLNAIDEKFYGNETTTGGSTTVSDVRNGGFNRTSVVNDLHDEMRRRASNDDRRMFSFSLIAASHITIASSSVPSKLYS